MLKIVAGWSLALGTLVPPAQAEDPARALRDAAARVLTASRLLTASSDLKAFDKNVEEALKLYYGAGQKDDDRAAVKAELVAAFKAARARSIKSAQEKAKGSGAWKHLMSLRTELDRRREEALRLIRDEKIYLREDHPDYKKGDQVNGQARVDQLILKKNKGSVQEIWEQGNAMPARPDAAIAREIELARKLGDKYLHDLGEDPDDKDLEPVAFAAFLPTGMATLRSLTLSQEEQDACKWNRAVEKYNESLQDPAVTADEKAHTKIVNEYREMLGLRAMFLDARLCRAAKKHSGVCSAAKKIWHEGSDGSPTSRVKAEEFPAAAGENVCMGYASGDTWWQGWYQASDHHRNALRPEYNCFGYGYSGNVGTENLAQIPAPERLVLK
jgi:uncharacterized protein YkwD